MLGRANKRKQKQFLRRKTMLSKVEQKTNFERNSFKIVRMFRIVLLFIFVLALTGTLTNSTLGASLSTIFQEDFSGDLSQWNIWHYSTPYYIGIIDTDGNPSPCLLLDDKLNYGTYAVSRQTFSYVGTSIEFSADIKQGYAAFSDQRTAFLHLCKQNVYIPGQDYFVRIGISGSSSPNPNKVYCRLLYEDSGIEIWESSEFSISNGDGWHNAKIGVRDSGIVDFYLDNVLVYTSIHPVTPAYDGQASVMIGRRKSLYDNVAVSIVSTHVTPSPSEQIADILDFVNESVEDETLVGNGPGNSAENKPEEFINMLLNVQILIENMSFEEALYELDAIYKKCDGQRSPPDFVTGPAALVLAEKIQALKAQIAESEIEASSPGDFKIDTGFDVKLDGFPFSNSGNHIPDESFWNFLDFDNNACLGMSAFAQTYYVEFVKNKPSPTHLVQACDNGVCPYIPNLSQWCSSISDIVPILLSVSGWIDDKTAISAIVYNMSLQENPIVVLLMPEEGSNRHAVLAYRVSVEGDTVTIFIYDPNSPGDKSRKIIYDIPSEEAEYMYFTGFNWVPYISW